MATPNDRLAAVDPRRRVNRQLYPTNADMPEFPAAVLLNHVGLRAAQVGALAGAFVLSPVLWLRSGFKTPLFSQLVPKCAGRLFALGYVAGPVGVVTMAIADKKGPAGQPISEEGVDDRAYRIVHNPKVQKIADFSSAGMVGAVMVGKCGLLGNMALGSMGGIGAFAFSNLAFPVIRKEYWPKYKPDFLQALASMGIDPDSLTTGGTPAKKK